jgi:hypothetical protein
MPKPSVGRIVHYWPTNLEAGDRPKEQPYPAMITHVFGDQCVNLDIGNDGSFPLREPCLKTSVSLGDPSSITPGTWSWPQIPERPAAGLTDEELGVLVSGTRRALQHHYDHDTDQALAAIEQKLAGKIPVSLPEASKQEAAPKSKRGDKPKA